MSSTILYKGKYAGSTYEEILTKDINYCLFIDSMKFPSKDMKKFQEWLQSLNLEVAKEKHRLKEIERINKVLTS